jgi:peptide deformylase
MIKTSDILDESDKHLRTKSTDVTFPLSKEKRKLIEDMLEHLYYSQIEKYAKKYDLRPGMGLAAPQMGINERFFVICHEETEGNFKNYVIINPEMISHSEELIYAAEGEGCLSVNREVEGHVPRHAGVTVEGYDINGNKIRIRAREELSICFQHEIDHLDGIFFYDRINPKKKFYTEAEMRLI